MAQGTSLAWLCEGTFKVHHHLSMRTPITQPAPIHTVENPLYFHHPNPTAAGEKIKSPCSACTFFSLNISSQQRAQRVPETKNGCWRVSASTISVVTLAPAGPHLTLTALLGGAGHCQHPDFWGWNGFGEH